MRHVFSHYIGGESPPVGSDMTPKYQQLRSNFLPKSPDRELGSIGDSQFSEDAVEVFFDGPFCQVQFVGYLFVQLRFLHKFDDLLFTKTQALADLFFWLWRSAASGADPLVVSGSELFSTAKTTPDGWHI